MKERVVITIKTWLSIKSWFETVASSKSFFLNRLDKKGIYEIYLKNNFVKKNNYI